MLLTATLTPPAEDSDGVPTLVATMVSQLTETPASVPRDSIDLTRLPIGDNRLSDGPESESIWSCTQDFGNRNVHNGPWINDDGTFDYTSKVIVEGMELGADNLQITLEGNVRVITGNGLPDHPTGRSPGDRPSEAYQIDPNRNSILL